MKTTEALEICLETATTAVPSLLSCFCSPAADAVMKALADTAAKAATAVCGLSCFCSSAADAAAVSNSFFTKAGETAFCFACLFRNYHKKERLFLLPFPDAFRLRFALFFFCIQERSTAYTVSSSTTKRVILFDIFFTPLLQHMPEIPDSLY